MRTVEKIIKLICYVSVHIDSVLFINILPPVVSAHLKYDGFFTCSLWIS